MLGRRVLLALAITSIIPAAARADWAQGLFTGNEKDFGTVSRGSKMSHSFTLTNTTGRELRIRSVRVSCNCTTAHATKLRLSPGETGTIEALMDTSTFTGSKSVTITVSFDKPRRGDAFLRVSSISGGVGGATSEIDLGVVGEGQLVERKLNIDHAGNDAWEVTALDFGSPHVKAEIQEMSRGGGKVRYELRMKLLATAPAGNFEDRLRVKTNDPKQAELVVLAKANIQPKLSINPDRISVEGLSTGAKVSRAVMLRASKPFKILRVENGGTAVEARYSADAKTSHIINVNVTMADGAALPEHLDILTDLDGEKEIALPIKR